MIADSGQACKHRPLHIKVKQTRESALAAGLHLVNLFKMLGLRVNGALSVALIYSHIRITTTLSKSGMIYRALVVKFAGKAF